MEQYDLIKKKTSCVIATRHVVPDSMEASAHGLQNISPRRRYVHVNMCHSCLTLCHMEGSAAPAFVLDGKWTHKEQRGGAEDSGEEEVR